MEERNEAISPNDGGTCPAATLPRVASGLHSEDSILDIESGLPTKAEVPESPEPPVSEPPNAVITPDGVQELPPWLIGSDGKPLPINERTLRLIRGKTFTVRHPVLEDCGHSLDMINFPKRNCQNCLFNWFNWHEELVRTAHEFYQQYGKERLIAMRGVKFTRAFLMFMSTVQHFLEQQKEQENHASKGQDGSNLRSAESSISN
jgi:hypothetical protein